MDAIRAIARTIIVTGLTIALAATHPFSAAAKVKSDWARVQRVAPGTKTTVVLYKDRAPSGKRKIEGHFRSATAKNITLLLPDGKRRTLQKPNVRKVLTYRPLTKRYQGWLAMALAAGVLNGMLAYIAQSEGFSASGVLMANGAFVPAAGLVGFWAAPKMGSIYDVPIERRDATSQPPSPEAAILPFLGELRSDRLRLQARRAVMRKDIPLDLSSLPGRPMVVSEPLP